MAALRLAQGCATLPWPRGTLGLIDLPILPSVACRQEEGDGDADQRSRLADDQRQAVDRDAVGDPDGAARRVQGKPDQRDVVCRAGLNSGIGSHFRSGR